jgi:hypothetical protein
MTARRSFLWLARTALVAFSVTMGFVGCGRQSEGERCDKRAAGDTDCNDGLICIQCIDLARGVVDRCCPSEPGSQSDARCDRADPQRPTGACQSATGGTGGFGARDGGAGMSGGGTGGTPMSSGGEGGE